MATTQTQAVDILASLGRRLEWLDNAAQEGWLRDVGLDVVLLAAADRAVEGQDDAEDEVRALEPKRSATRRCRSSRSALT